ISLTLSVTMVPSCVFSWLRPTRWGASKPFSPITRRTRRGLERTPATRSRAIFCDSLRRESRTLRFPGGYDRPDQHPDRGLSDRGDGGSQAMSFPCESDTRRRARHSTRATPAPGHNNETWKARPSGSSSRPPSGQRAFGLHGGDLGGQQFVVHGDLAHLGFQSGDFILAIVALAFLQG